MGTELMAMALDDHLQLQWKCGHERINTVVLYDLPGCGWVCFSKILSQVYLIPTLGGLGPISRL